MNERTLNLLALKYVDDVLIGAPLCPTEILLKRLNISLVVNGIKKGENPEPVVNYTEDNDPWRICK
jgi:glycerol-3-phosphate cytidylyltransferase-like family protein